MALAGHGERCQLRVAVMINELGSLVDRKHWLLVFGDIPNERENGEELLGGNRRPEQAQMLEGLKLALSHVITCQERAIFGE